MASFSAYTRYDNRKQFQYNKRNNDVVNNTNQRSRNNISNRNTINNDHVNRLYNWQQRNEQKKNSLKKKIAKAETPSFTPTKYAKAKNFRPVHKPTESDALQKHRERLNRAREKEKEKHRVHVPGKKWTGKSTMPKSPTLSYQTRMKKKGKSQKQQQQQQGNQQQQQLQRRSKNNSYGYSSIHSKNKNQIKKTALGNQKPQKPTAITSSSPSTTNSSSTESPPTYLSLSRQAVANIDERKKRIPVGAVPIVRKKPFTPATGTNAKNVYSDIYNDDNSYQYQHQLQQREFEENLIKQQEAHILEQNQSYSRRTFKLPNNEIYQNQQEPQQQEFKLPIQQQNVQDDYYKSSQGEEHLNSNNNNNGDTYNINGYGNVHHNLFAAQQNEVENQYTDVNRNYHIRNNNNDYNNLVVDTYHQNINNNNILEYEKQLSPQFQPRSYNDYYNEQNYVYQPISLPPPPNTEITLKNENDITVANKTELDWEYVQRKTKFLTDRAKEKSDQLETKLKLLEFQNKKLLGLVPSDQMMPKEDDNGKVVKRTRSEKKSLKGHYRRMSKAAVIQTTQSGEDHVSTMGTAKRM